MGTIKESAQVCQGQVQSVDSRSMGRIVGKPVINSVHGSSVVERRIDLPYLLGGEAGRCRCLVDLGVKPLHLGEQGIEACVIVTRLHPGQIELLGHGRNKPVFLPARELLQ